MAWITQQKARALHAENQRLTEQLTKLQDAATVAQKWKLATFTMMGLLLGAISIAWHMNESKDDLDPSADFAPILNGVIADRGTQENEPAEQPQDNPPALKDAPAEELAATETPQDKIAARPPAPEPLPVNVESPKNAGSKANQPRALGDLATFLAGHASDDEVNTD